MENGAAILKNSSTVSYKTKVEIPICPSSFIPEDLAKRNEILCSYKNLHVIIHSNFICNNRKLETTEMPYNKGMVKWPSTPWNTTYQ